MLIQIGLTQTPAPLGLDIDIDEPTLLQAWEDARSAIGLLKLTDTKGDRVAIAAENISYILVREDKSHRVGFGR